jgi:glycerol uptake facilitator-like aquaporin
VLLTDRPTPVRRLVAEFVGTGVLVAVVVGSGIAAQHLSPRDVGLQLLENSTATVFGLAVLILVFAPVSGAHFNPVVSAVDWLLGRRSRTGLPGALLAGYVAAQIAGGIAGAVLANAMFDQRAAQIATHHRVTTGHLLGEAVATAGLVTVVFASSRVGRPTPVTAAAVAGWIGAAYWWCSSTAFANPAVTLGRMFSDTFAGIAPPSALWFIAAQFLGAAAGFGLVHVVFPAPPV